MSLLDNRVCEDDIQRVNAVRHHPKYEPGFEEESREEKVWYERGSNGLPNGYYLFSEVQEQYDNWQRQQIKRANMTESVGGSVGGTVESGVSKEHRVKKQTIFDKMTDKLLEYVGLK